MAKIIDKLSSNLKDAFAKADEIWIAVALLNVKGLNSIIHSIKKDCKINFIGGIDLPTDPAALSKILSLKPKHKVSAFIYSNPKISYHPKVYIVRTQNQLQSFIGSANCTSGGLENNIEMTIEIVEQIVSLELLEWFRKIELCSRKTPLTTDFITAYIPKYKDRISLRKKESKAMHEFKRNEEMKLEADIKERKRLVSKLILIRKSNYYLSYKPERRRTIQELKKSLDYPNFVNLDLASFWGVKELGTILAIRLKKIINNNRNKFTRLMKYICDDSIPLKVRYDNALNGKYSIANIGEGFISKILVMHNPKEYFVFNKEFTKIFKPFGLSFTRGLSSGDRYVLTRDTLKSIQKETNIDDFAVLDRCLFELEK